MNVIALLTASVGVGLGILFPSVWFLVPLCLALFLYDLWFRNKTITGAALRGAMFGFATGGAGVWWMWNMFPLEIPGGMPESTQYVLIALVWGVTALLAGVTNALAGSAIFLLRKNVFAGVIAAFIFVVEVELRMWAYALYSYSPESLFGPHFSQTSFGYALAESPYLLQLAYPFGIYGLTFAAVIFAAGAVSFVRAIEKKRFGWHSGVVFAVIPLLLIYPLAARYEPPRDSETLRVAVLSTASPQGATSPSQETVKTLIESASGKADILVLPEGVDFEALFQDTEERKKVLREIFDSEGLVISSGYETRINNTRESHIVFRDEKDTVTGTYTKLFLMPQAEYYPWIAKPLYSIALGSQTDGYIKSVGKRLEPGAGLVAVPFKDYSIGALLCSEIMSPRLYKELVDTHGADLLVNLSNPTWFHGSKSLFDKTLQIAKVHAVQNRKNFLVSSHGSPSFILAPSGEIIARASWGGNEFLFANLQMPPKR